MPIELEAPRRWKLIVFLLKTKENVRWKLISQIDSTIPHKNYCVIKISGMEPDDNRVTNQIISRKKVQYGKNKTFSKLNLESLRFLFYFILKIRFGLEI